MQNITILISDDSESLNPGELADFLYLFRATNLALNQIVPKRDRESLRKPLASEIQNYATVLAKYSPKRLNHFFDPETEPDFLKITNIRRQSPIEIDLSGWGYLIILGVIFSGGTISILGGLIKAELPPFGKGLKYLREALGLTKTVQARFGIRGAVIKLNKEEYQALFEESKGQGGFQDFLSRLQRRINRRTKEIELGQDDLERIFRYKAKPKRGGFQGRFKRIFGRHFPEKTPLNLTHETDR